MKSATQQKPHSSDADGTIINLNTKEIVRIKKSLTDLSSPTGGQGAKGEQHP